MARFLDTVAGGETARAWPNALIWVVGFAVGCLVSGCESQDKGKTGRSRWETAPPGEAIHASGGTATAAGVPYGAHPFDPASMRIHPLTHMQRAEDVAAGSQSEGKAATAPRINCFVEFKDRWGDTCKALGTLEVQLYRPSNEPGQERQDAKWDADLTDLQKNADWFDPVTRAYRLQLEVPDWLGDPSKNGQIKLRVVYTPSSSGVESRKMRDEFVVNRS